MPAVLADLSIEARWIVPMTAPERVFENHTLVVRDGRILDLLPAADAAARYAATVALRRPSHVLMPGMVNAATHAARSLFGMIDLGSDIEFARDGIMASIARMLRSGITCFADRDQFPAETARIAAEQGMRAVVGLPVADAPSPWAQSSAEYLSRALRVRDEYKGHPLIATAFAPRTPNEVSDATFARVATLADELDAAILIDLHESDREIARSIAVHGARPMMRLWNLGLLTPALTAVHMALATGEDIELARRTGISITLCPESSVRETGALPPIRAMAASAIRLSVGTGSGAPYHGDDVWGGMKLLALALSAESSGPAAHHAAWRALAAATRDTAAASGLEADWGTLEPQKWADVCCVDLGASTARYSGDALNQLVFGGGRERVSDVWVAGRPLLSDGEFTRLDWHALTQRADSWAKRQNLGG
jgi:5-methylthioadenosine/S-adenosylhomocysteine deaminase